MDTNNPSEMSKSELSMQLALEASMRDGRSPNAAAATMSEGDERNGQGSETRPSRITIEDCIRNLSVRQLGSLPALQSNDGDTYIFIDPPSKQPEQSAEDYDDFLRRYHNPIIMKSERLTKASTMFKDWLGPSAQYRILRRRGLVGKLPSGIKYILDLTPPTEGDDAVYLTATLSCSEGVRFWHQACEIWNVSSQLVGGSEEWSSSSSPEGSTPGGLTLEYSPFRHRSAIRRVLAAIDNLNIGLDSAIKLWSTAVIAEYLGITRRTCTFLADSLLTWLRVEPNNLFIEVNPEATLRIAAGIENEELLRDTFALLIGEEALDSISRRGTSRHQNRYSTFGRKKESVPDLWVEKIEYASKAFTERHTRDMQQLVTGAMDWVDDLSMVKDLRKFEDPQLQEIVQILVPKLKELAKFEIIIQLLDRSDNLGVVRFDHNLQWRITPKDDASEIYRSLSPWQRTLTRIFWNRARSRGPSIRSSTSSFRAHVLDNASKFPEDPLVAALPSRLANTFLLQARVIIDYGSYLLNWPTANISERMDVVDALQSFLNTEKGRLEDREATNTASERVRFSLGDYDPLNFSWRDIILRSAEQQRLQREREIDPSWDWSTSDETSPRDKPSLPAESASGTPEQGTSDRQAIDQTSLGSLPQDDRLSSSASAYHERQGRKLGVIDTSDAFQPFFILETFFGAVDIHIKNIANAKLALSDSPHRREALRPTVIQTLTSLSENEWKYLPLWAGGLDDETGAIYADDPIEAPPEAGFSTSGPSIHTGDSTYSSSSYRGSDFDMMSDVGSGSTSFNLSTAVADGHSDQLFRGRIYTPPGSSTGSETDENLFRQFQNEVEERKAELAIRTFEHSQQAQQAEASRNANATPTGGPPDVCYDDIFNGADSDEENFMDEGDSDSDSTERGDSEHLEEDSMDDEGGVLV